MEIDRDTLTGFAWRVRKNLSYMIDASGRGADIHVVTQLATSLLGLIVFPYEYLRRLHIFDFKQISFDQLTEMGWPAWTFYSCDSRNLDEHVWHLRNALSHRRVHFSSDSRVLKEVEIQFWDRPGPYAPDNWSSSIQGDQLLEFVMLFSELLDQKLGS